MVCLFLTYAKVKEKNVGETFVCDRCLIKCMKKDLLKLYCKKHSTDSIDDDEILETDVMLRWKKIIKRNFTYRVSYK